MATAHLTTARALAVAAALLALLTPLDPASASGTLTEASAGAAAVPTRSLGARQVVIRYRSHTGAERDAYVLLPRWYGGPRTPAIPLVISPHGRGRDGASNARLWGDLASIGGFAVVSPDGQGNRLRKMSWGAPGQIDDLARMPDILARALPELRIDRSRIYAFGGSMGGHESLLLAARHPELLAGVASFDGVADFALQYENFTRLGCNDVCRRVWHGTIGKGLQLLAREEVGGIPAEAPAAYAERSPIAYARALAFSCVPIQIWWSTKDKIVRQPNRQSGRLLEVVRWLNPAAPVEGFTGRWIHTASFKARSRLPLALARFGLMPPAYGVKPPLLRHRPAGGGCGR